MAPDLDPDVVAAACGHNRERFVLGNGGRLEVVLDGGVCRGSDVVKALCLGARAVLIGRAYAYGLGAAGEAGVARVIDILRGDIIRTMKLLGCASVNELDRSFIGS